MAAKIGVVIPVPLRRKLFDESDIERLKTLGDAEITDSTGHLSMADACRLLADCEVGVGSWGTVSPCEELLSACPRLRLWEHVAGSVKHMFGPHLQGRDLTIASCAPASAGNVAEFTLGEIIVGVRRIVGPGGAKRKCLSDATIGVIGASAVGRRVIRLLEPFGPSVLLYDPFVDAAEADRMGARLVTDLLELCAACDVVTLHAPALPSTAKMLGAVHFRAMRDDAIFINTARGACVDEPALIAELEKGRLFAFLDVTDPEPAPDDSPLRRLHNVILTPHVAGPADRKIGRQAVDDIAAFLAGGSPRRAVTADMLDRLA